MTLHVLAISNDQYPIDDNLVSACRKNDISLFEINEEAKELSDKNKVLALRRFLIHNRPNSDDLLLVVEGYNTILNGSGAQIIENYEEFDANIVFSADAYFDYPESDLQYYYWKFYPRYGKVYNYLNGGTFIGKVSAIQQMIEDITINYHLSTDSCNVDDPYFTRYFVDCSLDIFTPYYKILLDSEQKLLSANRGNIGTIRLPYLNWVQNHSFQLLEKEKLEKNNLHHYQTKFKYLKFKNGDFINTLTKTSPVVINVPADKFEQIGTLRNINQETSFYATFLSLLAYLQAIGRSLLVYIINRFSIDPKQTFRFEKHKNPDYESTMKHFLNLLRKKEAFTFAHFNDGELNFIRKYINSDHKKTWNGRIQDQYDIPLAERLLDSIKYKQKNYYLGISCSTCAAPRRKVADEIIGHYDHKIGAMVFHHNQRYLPQIISQMRDREMFYVMNDYQRLDVLESLGVTVKKENIIRIPFVNSHKEYDNLKDRKFPDGAFVILMCGMLAKILIRNWYELNPKTTFIALGSTMDDFIQTTNTKYRPYPKKLPLTRNIHLIKAFLFGNKKKCVECYNI